MVVQKDRRNSNSRDLLEILCMSRFINRSTRSSLASPALRVTLLERLHPAGSCRFDHQLYAAQGFSFEPLVDRFQTIWPGWVLVALVLRVSSGARAYSDDRKKINVDSDQE